VKGTAAKLKEEARKEKRARRRKKGRK
jgi:hypothetical protein